MTGSLNDHTRSWTHAPELRAALLGALSGLTEAPDSAPLHLPPGGALLTYPTPDGPVTASLTLVPPEARAAWPHDPHPGQPLLTQQLTRGDARATALRPLDERQQPRPPSVIFTCGPDVLQDELDRHLRVLKAALRSVAARTAPPKP